MTARGPCSGVGRWGARGGAAPSKPQAPSIRDQAATIGYETFLDISEIGIARNR